MLLLVHGVAGQTECRQADWRCTVLGCGAGLLALGGWRLSLGFCTAPGWAERTVVLRRATHVFTSLLQPLSGWPPGARPRALGCLERPAALN